MLLTSPQCGLESLDFNDERLQTTLQLRHEFFKVRCSHTAPPAAVVQCSRCDRVGVWSGVLVLCDTLARAMLTCMGVYPQPPWDNALCGTWFATPTTCRAWTYRATPSPSAC